MDIKVDKYTASSGGSLEHVTTGSKHPIWTFKWTQSGVHDRHSKSAPSAV